MRTLQLRHALAMLTAISVAACSGTPATTSRTTSSPGATTSSSIADPATVAPRPIASATPEPSVFNQGRIAFVIGRDGGADEDVQVIEAADGSVVATVPRPGVSQNEAPTWEPDGRSLLFDSGRSGRIHLFRYGVETNAVTQLTFGDGFEGFPAVSPDGSTVAFDHADEAADLGIWLMDIDGSNRRNLVPPPPAPAVDSAPVFSPDGSKLAFIRKFSTTPPNAREAAYIVNLDGTGLRQLTDPALDVGRIRWSPDGTRLAFSDQAENGSVGTLSQDIWLVDVDGSGLHQITHNKPGVFTTLPDWSPDGSRLVMIGFRLGDDHNTIATMNPDGTDLRQIYAGPRLAFLEWPAWGDIKP
ncbi:MAG: hypothetical protein ABIZ52_01415 [Candidatus Limnocylindrales bacterium]